MSVKHYVLVLPPASVGLVLSGLGLLAHDRVRETIDAVRKQVVEQEQKAAEATPAGE